MRLRNFVALALAATALSGCRLFDYDNFDPPTSVFSGALLFNGEPFYLRGHSYTVSLWQIEPVYPLAETSSYGVQIAHDGTFRGLIFDGTYDAALNSTGGPWVPDTTRRRFVMKGSAEMDFDVLPYYTIQNETVSYIQPTAGNPGGSITATFSVGVHNTTSALDLVGVYVSPTNVVDRGNGFTIANSVRERTNAQINSQFPGGQPITITVPLPSNVHLTPSDQRRNHVFVRVGVKPVSSNEAAYTQIYKIDI